MPNQSREYKIKRVIEIAYRKGIFDAKDMGVMVPNKIIKTLLITSQVVAHEIYKDYEKLFMLKGKGATINRAR